MAGQGVDDLEEVLSERLQQLPAPASRQGSGVLAASQEEPPVVIPDELPVEERQKVPFLEPIPLQKQQLSGPFVTMVD